MEPVYHTPVLLDESITALDLKEDGIYVDATFGGGGHSREILRRLGPKGTLISFDRDTDAIKNAPDDKRLILVHNNFRFIENFVHYNGFQQVDGILADLGVSSHQFDSGERGFSFRFDAPLDMRMNRLAKRNAADIINTYEQDELARIFKIYGELDKPYKVAELVCSARNRKPIATTGELSKVVERMYNTNTEHKFLAKLYQALRIEVNMEMQSLEEFLKGAYSVLAPGGVLSVITYHSLEDRMVKNFMKTGNTAGDVNKDFYGRIETPFEIITRKPIVPTEEEISRNTRSRSAKLRVAAKK